MNKTATRWWVLAGLYLACMASALAANTAKEGAADLVLRGDAVCTACHDEADSPQLLAIGRTRHGVTADQRTHWATYRQALRDLPEHTADPAHPSWPAPPLG